MMHAQQHENGMEGAAVTENDMKMAQAMRKIANYLGRTEGLAWNEDTIADEVISRLKARNA